MKGFTVLAMKRDSYIESLKQLIGEGKNFYVLGETRRKYVLRFGGGKYVTRHRKNGIFDCILVKPSQKQPK